MNGRLRPLTLPMMLMAVAVIMTVVIVMMLVLMVMLMTVMGLLMSAAVSRSPNQIHAHTRRRRDEHLDTENQHNGAR